MDKIRNLLDHGDYRGAEALALDYTIWDYDLTQQFDAIKDVGQILSDSISRLNILEETLAQHDSQLINVKETAIKMEEREHAVAIQTKNITDTCNLISELTENLVISNEDQNLLLYELPSESNIKMFIETLENLSKALRYQPDQILFKMRCVEAQKGHVLNLKSVFSDRLYQYFISQLGELLDRYSEVFINEIYNNGLYLPNHDIIHKSISYLGPIIHWTSRDDKSTFNGLHNYYLSRSKNQYDKEIKIFFECARELISDQDLSNFDSNIEKIFQAVDPVCQAEQTFYQTMFNNDGLPKIFESLSNELLELSDHYSKNGLCSLSMVVRLSKYLKDTQKTDLFTTNIYPQVLIHFKRNFDLYMEKQINIIRDSKAPKGPKCGILPALKNFELLAKDIESLFKLSGLRGDIDKWYRELVTELFKVIERVDHAKTPKEMVCLENYYHLHDILRALKISCLDPQRKEANILYKSALNAYVKRYFGRPLEKVNIFFEGVNAKLNQGVKEEEISFQVAFSKFELRKVLQMVTLREVKRGLEDMYRRIEKHAYEPDSNLIQVIWHAMQDEFLSQYKVIQALIERCYPASNLSLSFSINDILKVFSDIAQSH